MMNLHILNTYSSQSCTLVEKIKIIKKTKFNGFKYMKWENSIKDLTLLYEKVSMCHMTDKNFYWENSK